MTDVSTPRNRCRRPPSGGGSSFCAPHPDRLEQPSQEVTARQRDPDEGEADAVEADVRSAMDQAIAFARDSPEPTVESFLDFTAEF